jgi:prevent-host-death family protein
MKVSVAEAKNKLPKLIKAVEDGESVTIYRDGTPVVDIVRTTKAHPERPKFGTLKGKVGQGNGSRPRLVEADDQR